MSILAFVRALIGLASALVQWRQQSGLIDAGMATQALKDLSHANEVVKDALRAARFVRDDPDSDLAQCLRDKYRRD